MSDVPKTFAAHILNSPTGRLFAHKSQIHGCTYKFWAENGRIHAVVEHPGSTTMTPGGYTSMSIEECLERAAAIFLQVTIPDGIPRWERADSMRLAHMMLDVAAQAQEQGDPSDAKVIAQVGHDNRRIAVAPGSPRPGVTVVPGAASALARSVLPPVAGHRLGTEVVRPRAGVGHRYRRRTAREV